MRQLSGMDSAFLAAESDRTPMHVSAVMIYEPSRLAGKGLVDMLRDRFEHALHTSTVFRSKLVRAPLEYDHPYWVDDDAFDLRNHFFDNALARPGNWQQFRTCIADLHSQGLNFEHPLWEAHIVEGLDDIEELPQGSFAILLKLHHAAIDGVTLLKIIGALHSANANDESESIQQRWQPEKAPTKTELVWNSYKNYLKRPKAFWETAKVVVPAIRAARSQARKDSERRRKFKTRFNLGVSGHRVCDSINVDINQIKPIKAFVPGCTINDIVVSIVGGGLRRYLSAKDELPQSTLIAGAPINIRGKSNAENSGNLISMMRISVRSDIADPIERLRAVNASALESKAYAKTAGTGTMKDIAQNIDPQLLALGIRAASSKVVNDLVATPVHTMISNVPGPRHDLYIHDAHLRHVLGLGPLIDQVGLFHAVTSTGTAMSISFVSCSEIMPDPDLYRECLLESFEELLSAA